MASKLKQDTAANKLRGSECRMQHLKTELSEIWEYFDKYCILGVTATGLISKQARDELQPVTTEENVQN